MKPMKIKQNDILVHKATYERFKVVRITKDGLIRGRCLDAVYGADLNLYTVTHVNLWQNEYTKEIISPEALRSIGFILGLLVVCFFMFSCAPAQGDNKAYCVKKAQLIQKITLPNTSPYDKLVEVCLEYNYSSH